MEFIDRIFYRKINPSDFKKLYDIDKPENGGGQTYLEAAGISNDDIVDFLEYAEISDSTLKDESRSVYSFNAHVLGESSKSAFLEFAPRGGRNNYRISRQNMRYKHPAWSVENGFPEPTRDEAGEYTSDGNFAGIIDNLVIIVLRTTYRKYYAGYVNSASMPEEWPHDIYLERIFEGERRGVIDLSKFNLEFVDSLACPFGGFISGVPITGGDNILLYGVPGVGKSWTIQTEYCNNDRYIERVVFHPDYTYSDFVGQILPKSEDGNVRYEFQPGPFTKLLKKAKDHPENAYYLIIEEINRGNAPAIFGDVFQLLDRTTTANEYGPAGTSQYGITNEDVAREVYGDVEAFVRIPANMSILATMNTADQNVFTLDTAFQRRWHMRMIENSFAGHSFADKHILDTTITWRNFCLAMNHEILQKSTGMTSAEDKRLGVYFVNEESLEFKAENVGDEQTQKNARKHNRQFAEKVIKYLWDDAFKYSRGDIFEISNYSSLEEIVHQFMEKTGDERMLIFKEEIRNLMQNPVQ